MILSKSWAPPKKIPMFRKSLTEPPVWGKSDLPQNRLNRFWHEADIDGNGVIDFQEFTESLGIRGWNDGVFTLEDERLEPTAITHELKGKWSEANLHEDMFHVNLQGAFFGTYNHGPWRIIYQSGIWILRLRQSSRNL